MLTKKPKFVAYMRLSKKDETGKYLGLEAQQTDCAAFAKARGGEIIGEFHEVETGKNDARPELDKARRRCRKTGAVLLVAKLDRLSRNVRFLMELRDSNVQLAAANIPDSNTLTFTVMAGLAQHERETISQRTKDALAAAQMRRKIVWNAAQAAGYPPPMGLLGGYRANAADISRWHMEGARANKAKALETAELLREDIEPLVHAGLTLRQIAAKLSDDGNKTPRGKAWSPQGVKNLLERLCIERSAAA